MINRSLKTRQSVFDRRQCMLTFKDSFQQRLLESSLKPKITIDQTVLGVEEKQN